MNKTRISLFLSSFSLLLVAGCASHHGQADAGYGSQVISSPKYGTTASNSTYPTASQPPVYYPSTSGGTVAETASADAALANQIRQSLGRGNLADVAPNINVFARNGTVTLTGTVPSEQQRQAVETLVRNTSGVAGVNDQLQVGPTPTGTAGQPSRAYPSGAPTAATGDIFNLHVQGLNETDRTLAQQILEGLRTDTALASLLPTVNINVANGKVVLQGTVENEQQKQTIDSVVRRAAGPDNVQDQLQTRSRTAQ